MSALSQVIDRAVCFAATAHRRQTRKGSDIPYIAHPVMVGLILQRAGFPETTVAAGILHDVVEDTDATLEDVEREFGAQIARMVEAVTETKTDAAGRPLPWQTRKDEKLAKLAQADTDVLAIAAADKLHNLAATLQAVRRGEPVWDRFNADRERWLSNAQRCIDLCHKPDSRLQQLVRQCRDLIRQLSNESATGQ